MHSVTSNAVSQKFKQYCLEVGIRFWENFDISYQSGGEWYDTDIWWRVFVGDNSDADVSNMYLEITVVNLGYYHASPNVTKYIISPQWRTLPTPSVIQICQSNTSCHGCRVGRDSSNHWYVDLHLRANYYHIFAQGFNFTRSTKQSKVSMSGFSYVSSAGD